MKRDQRSQNAPNSNSTQVKTGKVTTQFSDLVFNGALLDAFPIGIDMIDLKGRVVFRNKALEKLFPNTKTGNTCWKTYKDDKQKCSNCPFKKQTVQNFSGILETVDLCNDKVFQISHWMPDQKSANLIFRIFEDITPRTQPQEALRESNQLNAQIISSIQEGIIVYDRKLNFRFWNPEMEKITGYAASEVLTRNLVEVFPLFRNLAIRKQLLKTLRTNETTRLVFEYRIPEKGRSGWVSQWNAPLRNSVGRIVGIISNVRDITQQKQFEEQRDRLAAIVDSANDGIIGKTLDDIVVSFNSAAERIYGYSSAEIVGHSIARVIPADRRQELQRIHHAVARGESMEPFETVRVRKDGRHIDVSLTASPVKNSEGRVVGISTIVRDITERKRLEEQLSRSQKMEAIGQLAAGLAHDFNNLIAVIRANASLLELERDKLGPESVEYVDEMIVATENASKMVRQLLDFGRKRNFSPTVLDLNPQIERLGKTMKRILGGKIDLQFEPAPALPRVLADVDLLDQVIFNLAINARDAMQAGGKLRVKTEKVRIDKSGVQAHPEARAGDFVRLSFIDTGTGIAPAHLPHIFEPFFTTKDPGKGVGLGLPTVSDIVRQHKGWIEVSSQWGAGSAFKFYIPVAAPTKISRPKRANKSK